MEAINRYKQGMRVQMWDDDDEEVVYGKITRIMENSIMIKWDDINEPLQHFDEEFPLIQPSKG